MGLGRGSARGGRAEGGKEFWFRGGEANRVDGEPGWYSALVVIAELALDKELTERAIFGGFVRTLAGAVGVVVLGKRA